MKDSLDEIIEIFPKGTKTIGTLIVVILGVMVVITRTLVGKR